MSESERWPSSVRATGELKHLFENLVSLATLSCYTLDQSHVFGAEKSCSLVALGSAKRCQMTGSWVSERFDSVRKPSCSVPPMGLPCS